MIAVGVDLLDRLEVAHLEAELAGVLAHLRRELGTEDRLETGIVLDQLGVEQLAPERAAVQQDCLQVHPGRVQPRGQAGRPAADDDDVVIAHSSKWKYSRLLLYS